MHRTLPRLLFTGIVLWARLGLPQLAAIRSAAQTAPSPAAH
jgi:hypothetical protein